MKQHKPTVVALSLYIHMRELLSPRPNTCMLGEYSLCPTTIVVLAQYLSDQVHKEVHVSSHIDVQVQTCNDAPGSELRRQRQRDGGSNET